MYFTPVHILSLILTNFCPHYNLTLVPFHPTPVQHLQPNSDHLQQLLLALTLRDKLRTQTFRKGATHKLKPSPSDITTIGLSNSVIGPQDHRVTKWNEGMDEDIAVLHWLSKHAGLTSECVTEVIELFTRRQLENTTHGTTWNEAAKQVMQPPPHPAKAVEPTTASSSSEFDQCTLLD